VSVRQSAAAAASLLPQVNLLPPEVAAKRGLVRVKRWLGAFVVLAFLAAAGGVVLTMLAEKAAQDELAFQQGETERLTVEQQKYAEVPVVLSQLDRIGSAREVGMTTEVLWREYVSAIAATAPPGITIDTVTVTGATPYVATPLPADALSAPSVGSISFTAESLVLPDTAAWLDALEAVPGFADPWFSDASVNQEEDLIYYKVTATVQLNETAFAHRFTNEEAS
jgi:hypothetical protein